jgi:hypothetical protein
VKRSVLFAVLYFGLSPASFASAEEATTTSVQTEVKTDIDAEVEDSKLRANSGAKSRFSSSLNLSYSGSSLRKPFDDVRPNVDGSRLNAPVSLSGMVGLRYRFTTNTSLFAATGISKTRPFHNNSEDEWEANNVMMHLNSTFRYEQLQVSSTWLGYVWTQDYMRAVNTVGTIGYALSALSQIGQSRFRGGMSGSLSYTHFDGDRGTLGGFEMDVRSMQEDFTAGFSPSLQYRFNDKFNAYTSLQLLTYGHSREDNGFKLQKRPVSQNIGFGIAVLRDLYLAPNLDFRPKELEADKTSVNLSAIINL